MPLKISCVAVRRSSKYSDEYSLSCHCDGARYHVWVNVEGHTLRNYSTTQGPILFKNPLVDRGQEGYYSTRKLATNSKFGIELIGKMFEFADKHGLWEKAEEEMRNRENEEMRQHHKAVRLSHLKEAGPEMFKVLEAIAEFWASNDPMPLSPGAYITEADVPISEIVRKIVDAAPGCPDCLRTMNECTCPKGLQHP